MLVEEAITVPAWISFSCCDGKHTSRGEPVEEAMAAIARFDGIIAAGINCTSPKYITSLVPLAKKGLPKDRRLIVYPNKGGIWDNEARSFVPDPDEGMSSTCLKAPHLIH
jgi:homocysteine S-methyltransferase